jgi:hypothetical protein
MKIFLQALGYGALALGLLVTFSLGYSAYVATSGEKSDILQNVKYIDVNGENCVQRSRERKQERFLF